MSDRTYISHIDFYQRVYGHALREVRPAGRTGARMLFAEQTPGDWSDAANPDLVIAVHTRHRMDLTLDIGGGRVRQRLEPGCIAVAPPGFATTFLVDTPHDLRLLALPYAALLELAGPDSMLPQDGDFGWLHKQMTRDEAITHAIGRLWAEGAGGAFNRLSADGTILQIAARLLTLRSGGGGLTLIEDNRLPESRLRRVAELLRSDLARDLGLAEVASTAGMSPFHFARQFSVMFGMSPIQYRIAARIEAAQQLLRQRALPVAEVARLVGYADVSRFGAHFRRQVGMTPSVWRAR